MQYSYQAMIKAMVRGISINLITAVVVGLIGLGVGYFYLSKRGVSWHLPDGLMSKRNFIAVGSMHNFSDLGGAIGTLLGVGYQVKYWWEQEKQRKIARKMN
ncbi:hypothetical protein GA0116948_109119 [Chitinophaga costaii]|uniref:Uncharacterized protein n=1 Tax=Chitinophaga costaii TaxID=1335309 RepID=A0A1C4EQJ8_9BACT|nr:hypothetical protein [Chitinophaga costaii]SCC45867.1 hypothetical protein GA0116948_109119 [Chitinophaga costaii]